MKFLNYIFIGFFVISYQSFSQPLFNSPDTLLAKTFNAVNLKDSVSFVSLLNKPAIFKGKTAHSKSDSLLVLEPFTDSFSDLIASLEDMSSAPEFTVAYQGYELMNQKAFETKENGKIRMHVSLLINNTFIVKMPFIIVASNGNYSIEMPMSVMFLEQKE